MIYEDVDINVYTFIWAGNSLLTAF